MSKKFAYTNKRKMTPRPGNKFSTTYYDLPETEYTKLKHHVNEMIGLIERSAPTNPEFVDELTTPIKKHRRKDGTYYTALDIILDLRDQMAKGNDITDSMINRWHSVFANSPDDIELIDIELAKETASTYNQLFGE
jgi:hypothetical protein